MSSILFLCHPFTFRRLQWYKCARISPLFHALLCVPVSAWVYALASDCVFDRK
jgi:hypothetical protein